MTALSTPATLHNMRNDARDLLNEFDAADGLACYYTLHHDAKRTTLAVHHDSSGMVDGFLAHCMTGFDLFRPLITMRLRGTNDPAAGLIDTVLKPGRPYLLVTPPAVVARTEPYLDLSDEVENHIYRLDPARLRHEPNALVITRADPDGNPRAEIVQQDVTAALAGVNWRSPIFAEVFVRVEPEFRKRGWGRAVVRAVCAGLLQMQVTPLYSAATDNDASHTLAADVGFVDTGAREVVAQATRK